MNYRQLHLEEYRKWKKSRGAFPRQLTVEHFEYDGYRARRDEHYQAKSLLRLKGRWLARIFPAGSTVQVTVESGQLIIRRTHEPTD